MAITNFTPGFTIDTITSPKIGWSKGLSLGASNKVSLSNPLGDLNIEPKAWQNLLGNINMGQLATMALPMVTGVLKSAADKPLQNMTPEQRQQFEAIYGSGDSVLGDLFSMKQNVQNSIDNINNNIHTNTGALGSTQALVDSFNSTNFDAFKQNNDKMSFGQGLSRIADSAAKGFSTGMATGNPFIGLFSAAANAIGSGVRMAFADKNRNTINNAAELALNRTLDNQSLQAENTQKQIGLMNLANANYAALGGQLNYNIDNKYLANDYMSKLNNRVYKPQFDSMNYFAMGGMPDFNEFNTGGTHEQNPNGGIPQGMDKQGIINTVEQGETKTTTPEGDYIFSDRLKLSKEECKQLGVPKDSTYAEASKILRKEYDEMPNDEIARRGWEQSRDMLIQSQEMQKQEIALKEARKQGLNSPKMQGINSQVMQDMYYNKNPQEDILLQQGINPNIYNAFGGNIKRFDKGGNIYDIVQLSSQIPSIIQGIKGPDYSYANEVLNNIGKEDRLSIPNNYTYHTYNPVDELQYLNKQQAQDATLINTLQNTSNPSRNSSILAATAQNAANRSKLLNDIANINYARKAENTKLNNAITDKINSNLIAQAQHNLQLDSMDYNKMIQGLKMKQEADNLVGASLSSGLTGVSNWADARRQEDNSLGIAALSAVSQGVPFTEAMINSLYGINSKLGDIGFSTRSDYSAYKNMAQRRAIINALKEGKYNKNIYGNLGNYLEDQSIKDYIISQYNANPNWTGIDLGLSADQLQSIIKSINTGG